MGDLLDPGESFHNANSVGPDGIFRPGFTFEVVVEADGPGLLPSVAVWSDHGNMAIPGASIPAGAFVEIPTP